MTLLRPLGWMSALVGSIVTLFLSYVNPALGLSLLIAFVVAGAAGLMLLALLDILARVDLERRQRIRWALVALLCMPPLGAVVYLFLGRARTLRIFRVAPLSVPERRTLPSAYRVGNPFHRR